MVFTVTLHGEDIEVKRFSSDCYPNRRRNPQFGIISAARQCLAAGYSLTTMPTLTDLALHSRRRFISDYSPSTLSIQISGTVQGEPAVAYCHDLRWLDIVSFDYLIERIKEHKDGDLAFGLPITPAQFNALMALVSAPNLFSRGRFDDLHLFSETELDKVYTPETFAFFDGEARAREYFRMYATQLGSQAELGRVEVDLSYHFEGFRSYNKITQPMITHLSFEHHGLWAPVVLFSVANIFMELENWILHALFQNHLFNHLHLFPLRGY